MSYGLSFSNDDGYVILDSEIARMCVVAKGQLANDGSSNNGSTNYFPRAIITQEPPLIFVRPDAAAALMDVRVIGSPGYWTGFYIISRRGNGFSSGKWFACTFGAQSVATYGLRLWDENEKLIFDSDTPAAVFTQSANSWIYTDTTKDSQGIYTNYYSASGYVDYGDYLMINNISMNLVPDRRLVCSWNPQIKSVTALTQSSNNPFSFSLSAFFAKMVAN